MKKNKAILSPKHVLFFLGCCLSLMCSASLSAQVHNVSFEGAYHDVTIPNNTTTKYLILTAVGGDAGAIVRTNTYAGGRGALVKASFEIGTNDNQLKPEGTIRFMVGGKGEGKYGLGEANEKGSGGGGGSGIAYKGPATGDKWKILLVAGGGGGAHWSGGTGASGRPGKSYTKDKIGEGNSNYADYTNEYYAGSGAFLGPPHDEDTDSYPHPGWLGGPNVGVPTGGKSVSFYDQKYYGGGWGFGAGGGGDKTHAHAGGGGGYTGGHPSGKLSSAGLFDSDDPADGGTSFVNEDMSIGAVATYERGTTGYPEDGYALYEYSNSGIYNLIQLVKNPSKCIDNAGGGLSNGNNIQLWGCHSGNQNEQWWFDGMVLRNAKSVTKCLDLQENKEMGGTNIQLYDCNGTNAQKWIYDGVSQKIRLAENWAYCLDLYQGSDNSGTNVQLGVCDGIDGGGLGPGVPPAQQWIIDGASTPDMSTKIKTIRPAGYTDKCIENANGELWDGTNIRLGDCQSEIKYQQWKLDGETIKPAGHPNKCVDLTSSNTADGTNIQLYECNGTDAQKWIYDGMTQAFRSGVNPDKCLSHWLPSPIQNITLSDCNGSAFQRFVIE